MCKAETVLQRRPPSAIVIFVFTLMAVALHGYHYGIEDEAIYLPAIKKLIDPSLYPVNSELFMAQSRGTALPWLIAGITRATHLQLPWVVFAAQFVSIYMLLFGCWRVGGLCFARTRECLGAVALITALLTIPVAGTSIYLADQHLHPRTLAVAFGLMAICMVLERRLLPTIAFCAAGFVMHPLMAVYGIAFVVLLALPLRPVGKPLSAAIPFLASPTAAWREAVATRGYYTLRNWQWFEWLGILVPFAVVWWLGRLARREGLETAAFLMRRMLLYAAIMCVLTFFISLPRSTDFLWPLQPFRYLHTVYLLMFLIGGGLLARIVLKGHVWRWVVALLPLAAGMSFAQFEQFADSAHIDIPGARPTNPYVEAFQWVRDNTPRDAYFALHPDYMTEPMNNNYGFRAIAERSQMADISKDAAVVTVAPPLAPEWKRQVDAIREWNSLTHDDFVRLRHDFGVGWLIIDLRKADALQLVCPYHTSPRQGTSIAVCRTPGS